MKALSLFVVVQAEQLRAEYKVLALQYHPDRNPAGKHEFEHIQAAFEVLSNPRRR